MRETVAMFMRLFVLCACVCQGLHAFHFPDSRFYTDDAVVIEVNADVIPDLHRHKRDLVKNVSNDDISVTNQRQSEAFGLECETDLGRTGICKTFKDCYPLFKVSDLTDFDGSIMGHYDACSFINEENMEVFGICCTEPVGTPPQETLDELRKLYDWPQPQWAPWFLFRQIPAQWPPTHPPLPTHPPDHTAPTHPPFFGAGVTRPTMTTTRVTTKYPTYTTTKQTTTRYPSWPPGIASRPPGIASRPPTMIPASDDPTPANEGECGVKNGLQDQERIVGGHNADMNEWPWIVALFNGGRQFCGGSLISDRHILSAAHCVAHMTSWDVARLIAKLGDHNIRSNTETHHIDKKIKRVVRHRNFDMRTLYNDISILTVDSPVTFSRTIRPICLPMGSSKAYSGNIATVIGWGSLREGGMQPSILQEVSIPIWPNTDCRIKYGGAAPGGIVEHMVCAGRASMDSCSGDSGGPLMVLEGGKWTQIGVVSWGIGCGKGQYPGVYTRLTAFLPWITKNTK